MQITRESFVDTLLNMSKFMHAHEDFHKLHAKQLKLLTKVLKIEGLIEFDYAKKILVFKPSGFLNDKKAADLNQARIVDYANYYVNDSLRLFNTDFSVFTGSLTSNDEDQFIAKKVNLPIRNAVIRSHADQIKKECKHIISELLNLIYRKPFSMEDLKNSVYTGIEYNNNAEEILTEEEFKILNDSLDDIDYM